MLTETFRTTVIKPVTIGTPPSVINGLRSDGSGFWNNLSPEQKNSLSQIEKELAGQFPDATTSPYVSAVRELDAVMSRLGYPGRKECLGIAIENALRILEGSPKAYSPHDLQERAKDICGQPPVQLNIDTLLTKLNAGAVAVIEWPFDPYSPSRHLADYVRARTIAGFTKNQAGLFFHVLNPFEPPKQMYSLRDLAAACLGPADSRTWIIEKAP